MARLSGAAYLPGVLRAAIFFVAGVALVAAGAWLLGARDLIYATNRGYVSTAAGALIMGITFIIVALVGRHVADAMPKGARGGRLEKPGPDSN